MKIQNSMKSTNIISYIGLTLFTAYAIFYWISPNMADLTLFFVCLYTFGVFFLFLLASCGFILKSCIKAFSDKENIHYRICAIWTALLIIFWILIPSGDCDPYIQEEYYESHKDEIWETAHQIDKICKDKCQVHISEGKSYTEFSKYHPDCLSLSEFDQIKKLIDDADFEFVSYSDSICEFGFRRMGLGLYSYTLGLHGKKIEDEYSRIIYNDSVAFVYEAGAIGSNCYPGKEEYLKSKGRTSEY
ncbi:MAG: hypothetical protein U0K71_03755 [Paludibacteraceae bacterium]|nr:hypothetical protein [Paludibacteraceae bacterium]